MIANKGYKRYLKAEKGAFAVDLDTARDEERFDGMWVLRTNTELTAVGIALRYQQLWMVEQLFRTAKSLLDTRPIFHKTDATICGSEKKRPLVLSLMWRQRDDDKHEARAGIAITADAVPRWFCARAAISVSAMEVFLRPCRWFFGGGCPISRFLSVWCFPCGPVSRALRRGLRSGTAPRSWRDQQRGFTARQAGPPV